MSGPPPPPEALFAEYHALKARADATPADWNALQKRVRAAKVAWTKLGDSARRQQLTDLLGYISRGKPAQPAELLTALALENELRALRAKVGARPGASVASALRGLWRRLELTRAKRLAEDPSYDDDHDELLDGEGELTALASELGIELGD